MGTTKLVQILIQWQEQEEDEDGEEELGAKVEPDVPLLARSPQGLQRAHAGDHRLGPAESAGGGERVPRRGVFAPHQHFIELVFIYFHLR